MAYECLRCSMVLMTVLCGLATEVTIGSVTIGAFWVLLMCRVGVGIGEAGCTPPANSLIADYYARQDRSQALGVYAMGVTLGTMFANLIGGWVTDAFDWRTAFFVVGLPGVLIAVVFKLTVKEPPRGYTDLPGTKFVESVSLQEAIRELMTSTPPSVWRSLAQLWQRFAGMGSLRSNRFFWFALMASRLVRPRSGLMLRYRFHPRLALLRAGFSRLSSTGKASVGHRLGAGHWSGPVCALLCLCFHH